MMRLVRGLLVLLVVLTVVFAVTSGGFLVRNQPEKADVIVVLAGETDVRPSKGLELLRGGYASRMVLDVPAQEKVYGLPETEVAQNYANSLPESRQITVCPVYGLSTKAEAADVARCLRASTVKTALIVTSDYHTRRALSTFRHELPQYRFSVAAASNPADFGTHWWARRQWAKINFDEWIRLTWWTAIDRWY